MGVASADDLSGVPLFEQLDADARAAIAPWFELRDVSPDVKLVGEGAPGYSFFVLRDGTATVSINGVEVGRLVSGDAAQIEAHLKEDGTAAASNAAPPSE